MRPAPGIRTNAIPDTEPTTIRLSAINLDTSRHVDNSPAQPSPDRPCGVYRATGIRNSAMAGFDATVGPVLWPYRPCSISADTPFETIGHGRRF
jgi:hypothetical protein